MKLAVPQRALLHGGFPGGYLVALLGQNLLLANNVWTNGSLRAGRSQEKPRITEGGALWFVEVWVASAGRIGPAGPRMWALVMARRASSHAVNLHGDFRVCVVSSFLLSGVGSPLSRATALWCVQTRGTAAFLAFDSRISMSIFAGL